ncbi:MAG: hypothetical protein MN733_05120 [Nitrososphaera sp.]|nr:hypothetical protein [Nitrososphaera sp.]
MKGMAHKSTKKGMGGGYEYARGGDMRIKEMGKKAPMKKMMPMKKGAKKMMSYK